MRRLHIRPSVVLALLVFAAACSSSDSQAATGDTVEAASVVSPTSGGGQLDWGSLEGQDTILWFWAPW